MKERLDKKKPLSLHKPIIWHLWKLLALIIEMYKKPFKNLSKVKVLVLNKEIFNQKYGSLLDQDCLKEEKEKKMEQQREQEKKNVIVIKNDQSNPQKSDEKNKKNKKKDCC